MRKIYNRTVSSNPFNLRNFLMLTSLFVLLNAKAFPGGTYTINASLAASATNYVSFTALANDLQNITRGDGGPAQYAVGAAGVQGPVIVNVNNATYTQQFKLPQITGMSATNTLTINGNGATIQFTPTVSTDMAVIDLNGADYVKIRNLTITNNAAFGLCVWIHNVSDYNTIVLNKLRTPLFTTGTATGYLWISNGTASPSTTTNAGNFNLIDSNDMRSGAANTNNGPYYAVGIGAPTAHATTNSSNNNTISNNNIQDFYLYGLYIYYANVTTIRNNDIHNTGTTRYNTKYGMYVYYTSANIEFNRVYNLNGNTAQSYVQYPVYFYNYDNGTMATQKFRNNIIQASGLTTIYCYVYFYASQNAGATLDIEDNTFAIADASGTSVANTGTIYGLYGGYFRNLTGNIFYNNLGGTGTKYLMYDFGCVTPLSSHKNNTYAYGPGATGNFAYAGSCVTYGDISSMYTAGLPTSNINVDPSFLSLTPTAMDLTPTSIGMANKGTVISGITTDNKGVTRSSTPDIGALEYTVDVQLTNFALTFPSPACAGYTSAIGGTIKNNSAFTIKNPTMAYRVNNNPKVTYNVPVTLAPGASASFNFPGTYKFSVSGNTTVKMFVSTPDDNVSNDSASVSTFITVPPGGSVLTQNTTLSSPFAKLDITGKPDITFATEKMVYDFTAPSRLGYTNAQYLSKWIGTVSAKTINGFNASSLVTASLTAPFNVTFNASKNWEDSTIVITVKMVDFATSCDTAYVRSIYVAPKAYINVKLATVLCEKSDIYFDNATTASSGSVEYEWNFGDGSALSTESSPNHNYATFGLYTVTLKATTKPYNFVSNKSYTINVSQIPDAKIINVNTCQGIPVTLGNGTIYGGTGLTSYTWNYGDGSPVYKTSSLATIYKNYSVAGPYTVTLLASADGCTNSVTKSVYQFAKPVANFSKVSGSCLNSEFSFVNTSTIALGHFGNTWNFNDAGNQSSEQNTLYTFRSAGTKNVKLLVISEFGCSDSITLPFTVKQTPTTDFNYPYACNKTATPFNNTTNLNGEILQDYLWSFGDGTNSSAAGPAKVWNSVGTKSVTLKTTLANTCSSEITKTIEVGVKPTVNFDAEDRCADVDVPFTNYTTFENGTIDYLWSFGDGNTSKLAAPVHNYGSGVTQTYTVQLKASIVGGCKDSLSKTVTVQPLPTTCDFNIVRNSAAGLTNYSYVPFGGSLTGITYKWLTGDGNRVVSAQAGASYTYNGTNKYCVTMVAKNAADCECSKTKCFQLSTDIISAESMNNALSVYPNPNNGLFNITLSSDNSTEMTVQIFNILGELVKTIENAQLTTSVDLSECATGVYVIKVVAGNQIATKKISITK